MRILLAILLIAIILLFLKLIFRILGFFFLMRNSGLKELIKTLMSGQIIKPDNKSSQKMVQCAKCQLYIPETKAYNYQGHSYCCEEHAKEPPLRP